MIEPDVTRDQGSQPDRPLPFPELAQKLEVAGSLAASRDLYAEAPSEEPEAPAPMTPAYPVPALTERTSRWPIIGGLSLVVAIVIGASFVWPTADEAIAVEETPAEVIPVAAAAPVQETPKPIEPVVEPKVEEMDPAASVDAALSAKGLTIQDAARLNATKSAARAFQAEPSAERAAALVELLTELELSRSDVKRKIYHATRLLRDLDRAGVKGPQMAALWRDLLAIRADFDGKTANAVELAGRLTDLEARARPLRP